MGTKRDRSFYLNRSADLVSRSVYRLCRTQTKSDAPVDLKSMKELCGVLKEAISLSLSLEKAAEGQAEGIAILLDDALYELAE